MKLIKTNGILIISLLLLLFSCKKQQEEMSDLDKLRQNNNRKTYPITKMDSTKAIQFITKQKIQELLDLSILYANGNRDTEIDSIIYAQMNGYFSQPDSSKLKPSLHQIDSLKVRAAKVGNIYISKEISGKDTLDFAHFNVEYFDKNRQSIGKYNKSAQYTLKQFPEVFKKEFRFYFENFDLESPKDSTSIGVTR